MRRRSSARKQPPHALRPGGLGAPHEAAPPASSHPHAGSGGPLPAQLPRFRRAAKVKDTRVPGSLSGMRAAKGRLKSLSGAGRGLFAALVRARRPSLHFRCPSAALSPRFHRVILVADGGMRADPDARERFSAFLVPCGKQNKKISLGRAPRLIFFVFCSFYRPIACRRPAVRRGRGRVPRCAGRAQATGTLRSTPSATPSAAARMPCSLTQSSNSSGLTR